MTAAVGRSVKPDYPIVAARNTLCIFTLDG